jgi:transposase InsO family protein
MNHDDPQGGHQRVNRTLEMVKRKYYWHNIDRQIREYVEECHTCQLITVHRHQPYERLEPLPAAQNKADWLIVDFITGLPPANCTSDVVNAILVIVDQFTKYAWYIACKKLTMAQDLARLLMTHIIAVIGVPNHIVSDRGSVFTSEFWLELCWYLGVKRKLSTAFHPQTDGQTERQNQTLEYFLRGYVNWNQDNWPRWLPVAQLVHNKAHKQSIGRSPAQAMLDIDPKFQIEPTPPEEPRSQDAAQVAKRMEEVRRDIAQ